MTIELACVLGAVVLGFGHLMAATGAATRERGVDWNRSNREENKPLSPKAARLDRAFTNFKETFPFFLAAVFLVIATQRSGHLSSAGAIIYLGARLVYLPIYWAGITGVRTAVWTVSALGIVLVLIQSLIS